MRMIKAVLFDLDGTLLNRDESVNKFINYQYQRFIEVLGHIPKEKYWARFIELDNRGYVWKDKVYEQLVKEFSISGMTWEDLLQDYLNEFSNHCVPFPNLLDMLQTLKSEDLILGMITNGYGQFQMDNIRALGIENYFDIILISEWEKMKKPDALLFRKASKKLHIEPSHCVFVGDHPINDVQASQNIGMIGIWKKDFQWNNVIADFTIDDLTELAPLIKRLNETQKPFSF